MSQKLKLFIRWAPRILTIIFILFLMLMSLDVFDGNHGFWGTVLGLFMHNIPTFILLIVLLISWKYEIVGAIVFLVAGLFYIAMCLINKPFEWYMLSWFLVIAGPAFIISILFFIHWRKKN